MLATQSNPLSIVSSDSIPEAVSARELYNFLGFDKSHWTRWAKKNIESNPFAMENIDWQGFAIEVNGNQTRDFALNFDFAERLAMMARTDKGEQIRLWFQSLKKAVQQVATQKYLSQEEILLQSAQILVEHKQRLDNLEERILALESVKKPTVAKALLPASQMALTQEEKRNEVKRLVQYYCTHTKADAQSVYTTIYHCVKRKTGYDIMKVGKEKNEAYLDIAGKVGFMNDVYIVTCKIINGTIREYFNS